MGFGVPVNDWFRGSLQKYTREILLDPVALNRGYFDQDALRRLIEDHVQGRANNGARIWALLNLELWHRIFIDKSLSVTG